MSFGEYLWFDPSLGSVISLLCPLLGMGMRCRSSCTYFGAIWKPARRRWLDANCQRQNLQTTRRRCFIGCC